MREGGSFASDGEKRRRRTVRSTKRKDVFLILFFLYVKKIKGTFAAKSNTSTTSIYAAMASSGGGCRPVCLVYYTNFAVHLIAKQNTVIVDQSSPCSGPAYSNSMLCVTLRKEGKAALEFRPCGGCNRGAKYTSYDIFFFHFRIVHAAPSARRSMKEIAMKLSSPTDCAKTYARQGASKKISRKKKQKRLPFPLSRSVLIRGDKGRDSFLVELCDCVQRKEKEDNKPRNKRKTKREAKAASEGEGEKPGVASVGAEKPLLPRTGESELGKDTTVFHLCNFKSNSISNFWIIAEKETRGRGR